MSDDITNTTNLEQLVVFTLSSESFGVDISRVSGIERMMGITRVPRSPEFVEGVVNLRGRVIPVVDLRKIFCLPLGEETKDTRIVVVDIRGQHIGCLVDEVSEVLRIPSDSVEPPSSLVTSSAGSDYLLGIAKLEGRMIILLDLEKVLSVEEAQKLAEVAAMRSIDETESNENIEADESDITITENKSKDRVQKSSKAKEVVTI